MCGNPPEWASHMKRFIEGDERSQITLLPECLDDYIAEDNPVRVVDVFVDELKLLERCDTDATAADVAARALAAAGCMACASWVSDKVESSTEPDAPDFAVLDVGLHPAGTEHLNAAPF